MISEIILSMWKKVNGRFSFNRALAEETDCINKVICALVFTKKTKDQPRSTRLLNFKWVLYAPDTISTVRRYYNT